MAPESALDQYRRLTRKGEPHFFEFLSREEFQAAYAVAAVAKFEEYANAFDLDAYATPGLPSDTWEEMIRRALRYLADRGLVFRGIELDGWEIHGRRIVEPRNLGFEVIFRSGSMPNLIEALTVAQDIVRQLGQESDAETLRDALAGVIEEKAKAQAARREEVM